MSAKKEYRYPKQLSILRFILNAESIRKNPIPFHNQFFEACGDTFSLRIGTGKHVILSRDNELAQHILQKHHKNYQKSELQTKFISKYLGQGLLTANGDFWLRQRRLIQPAFHKQQMNQLLRNMQATIDTALENIPEEEVIDVFPYMNQLAFTVVARSLFHITTLEAQMDRIRTIIGQVQDFLIREIRTPYKALWFKISGQIKKHQQLALETDEIIREIIRQRIASGEKHHDLLDMLLETRYEDTGEAMSTQQLIDEIKILFIAGHETTANALTFTLHLLGNHPQVQQKVFEEITHAQAHTASAVELLQQLPYTNAVINESMRLYPPAWITDRENIADDTFQEWNFKAKTLVGISFYELHRNPKYWENPESFDPERFLGERKKASLPYFYPFGAGPRMCIGAGFAIYEMGLVLSNLLSRYRVISQKPSLGINPLVTLKPVDATLTFVKR